MGAFGSGAVVNFLRETFFSRKYEGVEIAGDTLKFGGKRGKLFKTDGTAKVFDHPDTVTFSDDTFFVADGIRYARARADGTLPGPKPKERTGVAKWFLGSDEPRAGLTPGTIYTSPASFAERCHGATRDPRFIGGLAATGATAFTIDTSFLEYGKYRGAKAQQRKDAAAALAGGGQFVAPTDGKPTHPGAAAIAQSPVLGAITNNPALNLTLG